MSENTAESSSESSASEVDMTCLVSAWVAEAKHCFGCAKRVEKVEPEMAERLRERAEILRECSLEATGAKPIRTLPFAVTNGEDMHE